MSIFQNYGSKNLMGSWYNTDKYFASKKWLENKVLKTLRPSLQTIAHKENLIGVEVGIGNCINSRNILDHMAIQKLYLIDRNVPTDIPGKDIIKDPRVVFMHGDSLDCLKKIDEPLDFVYLDGSHEFNYVLNEIAIVYHKIKLGGLLAGHDYEQVGVMAAMQTFMINAWRHTGEKPNNFYIDSCRDEHPGYPEEYMDYGFPIDWWMSKDKDLGKDFKIFKLRNG